MPRDVVQDRLQNFRFKVALSGLLGIDFQAGFQSVTIPAITTDAQEYREGHFVFTHKQPGVPTVEDVTLNQGVTKVGTPFYDWMSRVIGVAPISSSGAGYRADITIYHYHITDDDGGESLSEYGTPSQMIMIGDAFPTSAKVSGDLDATAGDISIRELTLACESIKVINP